MLQAVIFDFDGVIVNSEPLHHAFFNRVLAEVSIEIPWEEYKKEFIGFDDRDALRYAFKNTANTLRERNYNTLLMPKRF